MWGVGWWDIRSIDIIGKDQKEHLDLIDLGSRLDSAVHWLCCLEHRMGLSGLLFFHSIQRKKRLPYVRLPGTLWILIKHSFPFLSGPPGRSRGVTDGLTSQSSELCSAPWALPAVPQELGAGESYGTWQLEKHVPAGHEGLPRLCVRWESSAHYPVVH